jgi:hypothetical protein
LDNSVQTSVILSQLTGTSSIVLTWVIIPASKTDFKTNPAVLLSWLGYSQDKIWQTIYGTDYFIENSWASSVVTATEKEFCNTPANGQLYSNLWDIESYNWWEANWYWIEGCVCDGAGVFEWYLDKTFLNFSFSNDEFKYWFCWSWA